MSWIPPLNYTELPLLPPAIELETKEVLKLCAEARVALEHLKMTVETAPFRSAILATIPILEARYSLKLEDINAEIYDLFLYRDKFRFAPPLVMQILRCGRALGSGKDLMKETTFDQRLAKEMCARANGCKFDLRTISNAVSEDESYPFLYFPPDNQEEIVKRLENWEKFVKEEKTLDPLIVMAVAHYQFEAMRPYTLGSGKTNRILSQLFLIDKGVIDEPYLCLSRHFANNRKEYLQHLLDVSRSGKWEDWLKFNLAGICESAKWTTNKAIAINELLSYQRNKVNEDPVLRKINSPLLADLLSSHPFVRIKDLVDWDVVRRKTGGKYLNLLASSGVLKKISLRRGDVFVNQPYVDLLAKD